MRTYPLDIKISLSAEINGRSVTMATAHTLRTDTIAGMMGIHQDLRDTIHRIHEEMAADEADAHRG